MSNNNETTGAASYASGITWAGLLAIVFIVLKLTGTISWSWWWVLSPLWIPNVALIVFVLISLAVITIKDSKEKR